MIKTCYALFILLKVLWKRHDFFTAVMSSYGWLVYECLKKQNKVIVSESTMEWLLFLLTNKKIETDKYENLEILNDYRFNDISKDDIVLDIGAGAGLYSLLASKVAKKIYILEPNIPFYGYIEGNPKIEILKDLSFGKHNKLIKSNYWNNKTVITLGTDLNHILEEYDDITVIKCDCEGGEWDGFLSCNDFKNVRIINIEYHTNEEENLNKFCSLLRKHCFNYTIKEKWCAEYRFIGLLYAKREAQKRIR